MNLKRIYIVEPVGGHGGMDLYDYGQALGLADQGYAVCLCTCDETDEKDLHHVLTLRTFGKIWTSGKLLKIYRFFRGYRKAFESAAKEQAKVVHLHFFQIGWLNLAVLRMAKTYNFKKVVTLHDVDPLVNTSGDHLHRKIASLADALVVHNEFSFKELLQKEVPKEKIHVIPHGSYNEFIPTLPPLKDSGTLQLLFFGQIKEVKGLDILLEALALARKKGANVRLTIAGRPWHSDWQKYEKIILEQGLDENVQLHLGYIPNEKMETFFNNAHMVVLPYRRIYQSGVLLLAMSYGKPCICSNLEPFKEIVQDGENGLLFQDGSAVDLAEKIFRLTENQEKITSLRLGAIDTIQDTYDWKKIGKQLCDLYESLEIKQKSADA